ncbi:hypothetical protein PAPHI01_0367 [Pancytospora philotis]|nr:hypothetical protein PAPHI01_0341 [Pancytospora philotis]KAI4291093.1 hypothetical protein PAPHI01_0367 [Pancytospora philotis]
MVAADTMFTDLPQDIKQKIIKIRNLASGQTVQATPVPLKSFMTIAVPSTNKTYDNFLRLCEASKNLKPTNVDSAFRAQLNEFKTYVELYKASAGEKDFIGEMDKTVQLLEMRYAKLRKNRY